MGVVFTGVLLSAINLFPWAATVTGSAMAGLGVPWQIISREGQQSAAVGVPGDKNSVVIGIGAENSVIRDTSRER